MKITIFAALLFASQLSFAQIPDGLAGKAKEMGAEKFKALSENCKEEKIKFCKDKEMEALKTCLVENKNNLTPKCKKAAGL